MIEVLESSRDDVLEVRITAPVSDRDYTEVLMPAIDAGIARADQLRLLCILEAGASDFTLGALWDDARMGLARWRGFERIAVVSKAAGVARTIRTLSILMPCPVAVFDPGEEDDARRWLTESLGAIHQTDLGDGVLHVALVGKVDADDYEEETRDLNAFIRANDTFRLLLDLREFDGWQGLAGVKDHFKLVRSHVADLDRVAIVGTRAWQKFVVRIGQRLLGKEARYFPADAFDDAKAWVSKG